jgi:hypothetical protein
VDAPGKDPPEALLELRVIVIEDHSKEVIDLVLEGMDMALLTIGNDVRRKPE